jgi:hypothetical protein
MISPNWPVVATPGSSSPTYDNRQENPEQLLLETQRFLERFIAYPSPECSVAHTLWILHAHLVEAFENTPRLAFLSPEPGSGKSRALELTEALVPRPELTVNNTVSFIFRSISSEEGLPTLLLDEADTVFSNKKADGNEDLRGLLNSGYRQGNSVGRTTMKGKEFVVEKFPSFCAVAFAGLGRLPDTLMTRSVIIPMKRRRADQSVEPYRRRVFHKQTEELKERIAVYAETIRERVSGSFPELPESIQDRDADLWEPLIAIADEVGGLWPQTARETGVYFVAESKNQPVSLGIRLLKDIREVFTDDRLSTAELLERLYALDTAPWGSLRGEPIDDRYLARELGKYGIKSHTVRFRDKPLKGYLKTDFFDAWERYTTEPDSLTEQEEEEDTVSAKLCSNCSQPLHQAVIKDGFTTCPSCPEVTPVTLVTVSQGDLEEVNNNVLL